MERYTSGAFDTFHALCDIGWQKCVAAFSIALASLAFNGVDKVVLLSIGVLTVFDFITAIMREVKLKRDIESRKIIKTAVKLTVYGIMVSSGYIAESILPVQGIPMGLTIAGYIAVTELKSILENANAMGIAVSLNLIGALKGFLSKK